MKRLAILLLVAMLAVPAPVGAFPPAGEVVGVGDSWVVDQSDPDPLVEGEPHMMRVTVLEVRTPRSHGLMRPPAGKRVYLLHLRYDWVAGRPVVSFWDWMAQRRNGRWLRMVPVRGLKRLPVTILIEDARPRVHGWLAWYGPGEPSRVAFLMKPAWDQRHVIPAA